MSHNHKPGEECAACAMGIEGVRNFQAECIAKYGFYVDKVIDADPQVPKGLMNAHTHGLDLMGHFDLQLVWPMPDSYIMGIFHEVVKQIKAGKKFEDGEISNDILNGGVPVRFVKAKENNRDVFRIIIPDKLMTLIPASTPGEGIEMNPVFARQYEMLDGGELVH